MLKMWRATNAGLATVALLESSPALAVPMVGGSGLATPQTAITFSEVGLENGTVVTSQYSAFGVTFGIT